MRYGNNACSSNSWWPGRIVEAVEGCSACYRGLSPHQDVAAVEVVVRPAGIVQGLQTPVHVTADLHQPDVVQAGGWLSDHGAQGCTVSASPTNSAAKVVWMTIPEAWEN